MQKYHIRRTEKIIQAEEEMIEVITHSKFMTLAMCCNNEPYLVTLNYGYDREKRCFYFHCASVGKKMDYMKANPDVWGQVIEDKGYIQGECDHAYRSIHFKGRVEFLSEIEEKKNALIIMINHLEENPEPVKSKLIKEGKIAGTAIGKVQIEFMTGKKYIG